LQRREGIQSLFKGLAENWDRLTDEHEHLKELRYKKWLPGHRRKEWFAASDVYSIFSRVLFETQAEFLDLPQQGSSSRRPRASFSTS